MSGCYTGNVSKISIYIDGNNLYRAAKELGFKIDYKKLRRWLSQKYRATSVYLFIGLIPSNVKYYEYLQESGFTLIFKQTVTVGGTVKGNCDAELVLKTVCDFFEGKFSACYLITGDGDFGCLVEFLRDQDKLGGVLAPNRERCSILIKNKNITIDFLNEHYHKFSQLIKEKAPNAGEPT